MKATSARPTALKSKFGSIPQALRASPSWVLWQYVQRESKWTKQPFTVNGSAASTTKPATWAPFDAVCAAAGRFDGIGFVLAEDLASPNIVGIDLDHVIGADGTTEPWAIDVLERFAGCYAERSPSGAGLRIFCRGEPCRCGKGGPSKRLEVYDYKSPRYLTVTGHALPDTGDVIEAQGALDWLHETHMVRAGSICEQTRMPRSAGLSLSDDEVLRSARGAKNRAKFDRLWRGEHDGDDSAADATLVSLLRFWTQDADQIDRLFRASRLMRDKWDSPRGDTTYGRATIAKMLAMQGEQFGGRPCETEAAPGDGIVLVRGSMLTPEPVAWLWRNWLALGKLHVLAGSPGQGKTTIALSFAATVTAGRLWPDGSRCEPANVLIWSGEDDPADTLLPRLLAMGADTARVYFVRGTRVKGELQSFDPARDIGQLTSEAERIGSVALLVVDPIVSTVAGDSHKNTEVRRALQPIVDLGARLKAAVLGISHFTKNSSGRDPTERVTGSIAFGAVARIVMCAAKVKAAEGEHDRRILARSKSNIGPDDGGFEYAMNQVDLTDHKGISATTITWGDAVLGTARDLLKDPTDDSAGANGHSTTTDAMDFLRDLLGSGPQKRVAVWQAMKSEGFTDKIIRTARERLGVVVTREGFGRDMASTWALPAALPTASGALTCPPTMHGTNGHDCMAEGTTGNSARDSDRKVLDPRIRRPVTWSNRDALDEADDSA